ncbi:MAG: hypothetical protein ACYTG0_34750 [Planctomycetota bacterium]|jgi:hypothetical protein
MKAPDVDELVRELSQARADRGAVGRELRRVVKASGVADLDSEAERLADDVWSLGQAFENADPAELREHPGQVVHCIVCRFEKLPGTKTGRTPCRLVEGW